MGPGSSDVRACSLEYLTRGTVETCLNAANIWHVLVRPQPMEYAGI